MSKPVVRLPLVAGTRDASWYARPDVYSVKQWRIATDLYIPGGPAAVDLPGGGA
jgi:hypothetical protein